MSGCYEKFKIYQTYSSSTSPNIYIHSAFNDVDFKSIMNKCQIKNKSTVETPMPDKISSNLKDTTKIVIKMNR